MLNITKREAVTLAAIAVGCYGLYLLICISIMSVMGWC